MPQNDGSILSALEQSLGYQFTDRKILVEAVTHRSFFHENPQTADAYNERLEFLGDSVLGLVVVEYLFLVNGQLSESVMAKTKSYLVKESVLSEVAFSLSLGNAIRLGKGEESTGGRKKKSLLADATEAIFGAIYMDGGYERAREVILRLFRQKIDAAVASGEFQDFKTDLQEKTQLLFGTVPEYRIIKQEGEEHRKIFTAEVYIKGERFGTGFGKSKKEAETLAAKEAIGRLKEG